MGNTEKEVRTSIPHKTLSHNRCSKCPPSALIHAFSTSLVRNSFMWYAGAYFFFCISHLLIYYEESEKMDSNMEIKRFQTHIHII